MLDLDRFPFRTILITGGTGTFGDACARFLLHHTSDTKIRIYSRDEAKQAIMREKYGEHRLSFLLGDVRDYPRLQRAMRGVDLVLHAAAMKQVPAGEYNPDEFVKTNIMGSMNTIEAAISANVKKVVMLSTDKAVHPSTLYGATKMTAERLFIGANSYAPHTSLCVTRYGNVMGSRGSVVEVFLRRLAKNERLPVTSVNATRFWMSIQQAVELVLNAAMNAEPGDIFIPNLPAFYIIDLVEVMLREHGKDLGGFDVIGLRTDEKEHELLLNNAEICRVIKRSDDIFVVKPNRSDVNRHNTERLHLLYRSDIWEPKLTQDDIYRKLFYDGEQNNDA